jgi:LytS/YehU family sensor histidine kinase
MFRIIITEWILETHFPQLGWGIRYLESIGLLLHWQWPTAMLEETWFKGLLLHVALVFIYLFYRFTVFQIRKEEQLRAEFERRLSDIEMNALRSQMNPHFIFNCLNSIDYYILKNETERASNYLNRFSRLIRLILQNSRVNYVSLKDELEALKLYIEMEVLRFQQRFFYEIKVEKGLELREIEIPPMLLQPYVENAIWHGLLHKKECGHLEVHLSRRAGNLFCVIEDNGIGREMARALRSKTATRRKSMGMRITEDRISIINRLYKTRSSIRVIDKKNWQGLPAGTRVELTIPLHWD